MPDESSSLSLSHKPPGKTHPSTVSSPSSFTKAIAQAWQRESRDNKDQWWTADSKLRDYYAQRVPKTEKKAKM
ncbi:hypothetical protein EW146_g5758 [Bondarzewia mesenterica]|uniref:Uncharacterized protein n=1 Tax=Bondarzewia mesenterica TaxID=1095465 RepID=A0A4S4LSC7_9AGAM|nr:hypothetical protein EW146_g5758 [Bondarzewia mesenterica]